MGGVGELGVPEVNDFVQYLVNQYKVFADGFLIDDPTEILDYDHDAIQQLQDIGRRDVEASGGYNIDG